MVNKTILLIEDNLDDVEVINYFGLYRLLNEKSPIIGEQ